MKPSRITATLALSILGTVMLIIHFKGGFMSGFGPAKDYTGGERIWKNIEAVFLCILIFLMPGLFLWMRSRTLLVIGALLLAPVLIVGCFCLAFPPLAVVILGPVLVWYYSARCRWRYLKACEAEQSGEGTSLTALTDVVGTPWENNPDHTNSENADD